MDQQNHVVNIMDVLVYCVNLCSNPTELRAKIMSPNKRISSYTSPLLPKRLLNILLNFLNCGKKVTINGIKSNLNIIKVGLEDGLKSGFKDLINYSISIELRYIKTNPTMSLI